MDNAKKMILIEPDVIEKLKSRDTNAGSSATSRLDAEMQNILRSHIGDREKCKLYVQALQRYLYFMEEQRQPIQLPLIVEEKNHLKIKGRDELPIKEEENEPKTSLTSQSPNYEHISKTFYSNEHILKLIPKKYLKKGEIILNQLLRNKDKIKWDENGKVTIKNEVIAGSNIIDLMNDVLRPLKTSQPRGAEKFVTLLKELSVPVSYIGNPRRIDYISELYLNDYKDSKSEKKGQSKPLSSVETQGVHTPTTSGTKGKSNKRINWETWTPY